MSSAEPRRERDWLSVGVGIFTVISALALLAFGAYKPPPDVWWWPYFVVANLLAVLLLGAVLAVWGFRGDEVGGEEERSVR